MSDELDNPLGGRLTLALVGVIGVLIGAVPLSFAVASAAATGLGSIVGGAVFVLAGVGLLVVAVLDPEGLDVGTRTTPSEAEMRDRRVDDPADDQ